MQRIFSIQYLLINAICLILIGACAPKSKKSETTLKLFSSFSATGLNMDGGAVIYGRTVDGQNSFSKVFKGDSEFTVDINYGIWNFAVVTYAGAGGNEIAGAAECASLSGVPIQKDQSAVDMTVSPAKCFAAGLRGLNIKPCTNGNFSIVSGGGAFSACGAVGGDGGILSYELIIKSHENSTLFPTRLISRCIDTAEFESNPLIIPAGLSGASRAPLILKAYSGAACSGMQRSLDIPTSLANAGPANLFYARPSGLVLDLAINIDGPGIDTTPPNLTINRINNFFDGTNNWINGTNQTTYQLTGLCETGAGIIATLDGAPITGSPFACAAGTYSITYNASALNEKSSGPHYNLLIRQADIAGNTTSHQTLLYKDTILPSAAGVTLPDVNIANQAGYNFSGSCDSPGALITGMIGSTSFLNTPCVSSTWAVSGLDLSAEVDGSLSFTGTITDRANNVAAITGSDPVKDTIAPTVPIGPLLNAGGTITSTSTLNAQWTASSDHIGYRFELYNGSCAVQQAPSGSLGAGATSTSFIASADSAYSFKVIAFDAVGNESSSVCSNNTIYDSTPPNPASSLLVAETSPTMSTTLNLSWTAATDSNTISSYTAEFYSDPTCISIKDTAQAAGAGTSYTTTPLSEGLTYLKIVATDAAGNTSSSVCTLGVEIDTTPPAAATLNPTNWSTTGPTTLKSLVTNAWVIPSPADVASLDIHLHRNSCSGPIVPGQSKLAQPNTTTIASFEVAAEGDYFYEVILKDAAGNVSPSCSAALTINQEAMGIGGEYKDGFTIGANHLYALTSAGLEVYDVSSFPTLTRTKTLRVRGFLPKRAGHFNNHIYLYDENVIHIWTTTGVGSNALPFYVGSGNTGIAGAIDHAFSTNFLWLISATQVVGIDITSPASPTPQAALPTGAAGCTTVEHVPDSGYLYIGCTTNLIPVDVTTPASPSVEAAVVFPRDIKDLLYDTVSDFLFGVGNSSGGHITRYNVGTPSTPTIENTLIGFGSGISLGSVNSSAQLSYCGTSPTFSTGIVDIATAASPPTSLRKLGVGTGNFCSRTVAFYTLFYALTYQGIHRTPATAGADTTDPNPYLDVESTNKIAINPSGTVAFTSHDLLHAGIYDLTNKENPVQVYDFFSTGTYRDAVFNGDNEVVTIRNTALRRIDVTTPSAPTTIGGDISLAALVIDQDSRLVVDVPKNFAYIGTSNGKVSAYNLISGATLVNDVQVCPILGSNGIKSMRVIEDKLFVTCSITRNMYAYSATNPGTTFVQLGAIVLDHPPVAGNISHNNAGDFLYVPLGANGLQIVSFAGNGTLSKVGLPFTVPGGALSTMIPDANTAFIAVGKTSEIATYNITTPTAPVLLDSESGPGTYRALSPIDNSPTPNFVYAAADKGGIQVFRISNPADIHQ